MKRWQVTFTMTSWCLLVITQHHNSPWNWWCKSVELCFFCGCLSVLGNCENSLETQTACFSLEIIHWNRTCQYCDNVHFGQKSLFFQSLHFIYYMRRLDSSPEAYKPEAVSLVVCVSMCAKCVSKLSSWRRWKMLISWTLCKCNIWNSEFFAHHLPQGRTEAWNTGGTMRFNTWPHCFSTLWFMMCFIKASRTVSARPAWA